MADPSQGSNFRFPLVASKSGEGHKHQMENQSLESPELPRMEKQNSPLVQDSEAAGSEDELYLSNKFPFFDVILAKSHVNRPYQLHFPVKILSQVPRVTVPAVLRCGGKNWNLSYIGGGKRPRFCSGWGNFVKDNDLKIGDACVFELRECSDKKIQFKVIILRNDLPPELQEKMYSCGGTSENPIEIA